MRIDGDEYDMIADGLSNSDRQRAGDVEIITGNHEDHGRVTLRRENNLFMVVAEDLSLVRPWGTPMERPADV